MIHIFGPVDFAACVTLVENGAQLDIRVVDDSTNSDAVFVHEGALAFARGEPLEAAE